LPRLTAGGGQARNDNPFAVIARSDSDEAISFQLPLEIATPPLGVGLAMTEAGQKEEIATPDCVSSQARIYGYRFFIRYWSHPLLGTIQIDPNYKIHFLTNTIPPFHPLN
jgi:hypothetical protein